jgi:hypothetical protein
VEELRNEELYYLYPSPNVIRVTKSRIRWVGHVARPGEVHTLLWWENLGEENQAENLVVDGAIILKFMFNK